MLKFVPYVVVNCQAIQVQTPVFVSTVTIKNVEFVFEFKVATTAYLTVVKFKYGESNNTALK